MRKTIVLACVFIVFVVTACAASKPQFVSEPAALGVEESPGGGFGETYSADFIAEERESGGTFMGESTAEGAIQRMVIKNADLAIVVKEPIQTMEEIAAMAEGMGGFVVSSNLWQTTLSSGAKVPHASITIRIPADRFTEALEKIKSGAGEVTSENVSGQDVTREYTDLQSRLRNLEAAEEQLQRIMEEATDTEDVLQVYNNLVDVREQIEVIKGQMTYYEQAAALSLIRVEITGDEEAQPLQIGGWRPVGVAKEAIETLVQVLQWLGDIAIWTLLCVLPVGIIVGIPLYFAWRAVSRLRVRRKEKKEPQQPAGESAKKA